MTPALPCIRHDMLTTQERVSDTQRQLACLPVKHSKIALPNSTTSVAESNWKVVSRLVCGHLVAALHRPIDFRLADYASTVMAQMKAKIRGKRTQVAYGKSSRRTILATTPAGTCTVGQFNAKPR